MKSSSSPEAKHDTLHVPQIDVAGLKTSRQRKILVLSALVVLVVAIAIVVPIAVVYSAADETSKQQQDGAENPSQVQPTPPPNAPSPTSAQPFRIPSTIDELNRKMLSLILLAAELSFAVKENENLSKFPEALLFVDEPDKALVVQLNDTCFAVFRETVTSLADWAQNLDPRIADDVCSAINQTMCCRTRKGYRDAYVKPSFRHEVEFEVRRCVADCPACEVIMTGSSQGGAVAQIAAVYMDDLKPAVITFGHPPTMQGSCEPLDTSRMYRLVNTIVNRNGELKYDPVPFLLNPRGNMSQFGHVIVLGEDLANVAHFAPDEHHFVPSRHWAGSQVVNIVHRAVNYAEHLSRLVANGTFPIGIEGWDHGFKCSNTSECKLFCGDGQCTMGAKGDPCRTGDECESAHCGDPSNRCDVVR